MLSDQSVANAAEAQAGVIARWQCLALGMSARTVTRRLGSAGWSVLHPGVYALAGVGDSPDRRRWAGRLAVGPWSVFSFEEAARLHGFPAIPDGPVVLTVRHRWSQRLQGVTVHQIDDVLAHHIDFGPMPMTTSARTIVDLAARFGPKRLAHVLDDAVAGRRTTVAGVGAVLADVARRGKPGVQLLASILDARGSGVAPAESALERAFIDLIARSRHLPRPIGQFPFPGAELAGRRVDFAWPAARLIVEVDGRRWHSRIADMKVDRERDLAAAAAGWMVIRLLYEHLVEDPAGTLSQIERAHRARQPRAA